MLKGFKDFLLRGNVVDLGVGIVIGAAFTAVINGFVAAFLTPLVGLATGVAGDFSTKSFKLGKAVFPYGQFIQSLISFIIVAAVVYFLVVRPINHLMDRFKTEPEPERPTRECPECLSSIPVAARRCAFCTAEVAAA